MPDNQHHIFALLVGVNRYRREQGNLHPKDLSGCEHDVSRMETLVNTFSQKRSIHLQKLLNEEADSKAVIKAFREHLGQAKAGDTALFYYSGHGTREKKIPAEFQEYFHADSSEGLVCHDGCTLSGQLLADKELAVLISEIPDNVHVVVILDSCHSGSGTRDDKERMTDPFDKTRRLDEYLDGWFSTQLEDTGMIELPQREHILLAAAHRQQAAREEEFGGEISGAFTRFLCEVAASGPLDYRSMMNRVEDLLRAHGFRQQPQLEPLGGASVNDAFLLGEKSNEPRYARLYWKAGFRMNPGSWRLELGAVHGLSTDSIRNQRIPVFDEQGDKLGYGKIESLELQESTFRPEPALALEKEKEYRSQALGKSLQVAVSEEDKQAFFSDLGNEFSPPSAIHFANEGGFYGLKREDNFWLIINKEKGEKLCRVKGEGAAVFVINQLQNIARYESLLRMQSPGASLLPSAGLECWMEGLNDEIKQTGEGTYHCLAGPDGSKAVPYQLFAQHNYEEDIYTALYALDPDFSIKELNLDADPRKAGRTIRLYHGELGSLSQAPKTIETRFLLIASLSPIKAGTLVQPGIPLSGLWQDIDLDDPAFREFREGGLRIRRSGFGRSQSAESWTLRWVRVRIEKK
ncbi:MAG: caspase family protein [Bacteroidia bacterium]